MKNLIVLVSLLFVILESKAGVIKGTCVNSAGEPVEYVSVGINNTNFGIISDSKGNFTFTIPDSLMGKSLTFSHISYETRSIPLNILEKEFSEAKTGGGQLKITLTDYAFPIRDIIVTAKKPKLITLSSRGMRVPGGHATYARPYLSEDSIRKAEMNNWELNFGVLMELEKMTSICQIEFDILRNSYDTLIMRAVVYNKDGDVFTPLMKTPHYINIEKSEQKQNISIDLSGYDIYTHGNVYVGLEVVDISSKGVARFPAFVGGGNLYLRNRGTSKIALERPVGIGFQVKGYTIN